MDITGARWGLEGAEAILRLRAVIANGDFDAYWRFHLRREHERIHHVKYSDGLVLAAKLAHLKRAAPNVGSSATRSPAQPTPYYRPARQSRGA